VQLAVAYLAGRPGGQAVVRPGGTRAAEVERLPCRERCDLAGSGCQPPAMLRRHRGVSQPGDALEVMDAVVNDASSTELAIKPPVTLRHRVQGVEQHGADLAGSRHEGCAWLLLSMSPGRA
jgi:hypothetical protein